MQNDEQRHGFENLLLMCGDHHKTIDNDPATYTVERLTQMKRSHEDPSGDLALSEASLAELLRRLEERPTVTWQQAGAGGSNLAAGRDIVFAQPGVSYEDCRTIALDVYEANFPRLSGVAAEMALRRAEALSDDFRAQLWARAPESANSLADPGMLHALFSAQRDFACSGDRDLGAVLVDLLVRRASNPTRDLMQLVLTESVAVAGRLTPSQFDALSLVFLLQHTRAFGVLDQDDFRAYFDATLGPLLPTAASTTANFRHLQYCGCVANRLISRTLRAVIAESYPHLVVRKLEKRKVLLALGVPVKEPDITLGTAAQPAAALEALMGTVLEQAESEDLLAVLPLFDTEYGPEFEHCGLGVAATDAYRQLLSGEATVKLGDETLYSLHPSMRALEQYWNKEPSLFTLTSVGMAIAHANLRRRNIDGYDLAIWIN